MKYVDNYLPLSLSHSSFNPVLSPLTRVAGCASSVNQTFRARFYGRMPFLAPTMLSAWKQRYMPVSIVFDNDDRCYLQQRLYLPISRPTTRWVGGFTILIPLVWGSGETRTHLNQFSSQFLAGNVRFHSLIQLGAARERGKSHALLVTYRIHSHQ